AAGRVGCRHRRSATAEEVVPAVAHPDSRRPGRHVPRGRTDGADPVSVQALIEPTGWACSRASTLLGVDGPRHDESLSRKSPLPATRVASIFSSLLSIPWIPRFRSWPHERSRVAEGTGPSTPQQ